MKVIALVFFIGYYAQIKAQVYRDTTPPTIRRQTMYRPEYYENTNDSILRRQQTPQLFNGASNVQYSGSTLSQPQMAQRSSLTEEQTGQPNYSYNNIYQPIPSYNANSNTPINEQELNQYGGLAPRPAIVNVPYTTTQQPLLVNQNGVNPESSFNYPISPNQQTPAQPSLGQQYQPNVSPLIPPVPQPPQGQQYQPSGASQSIGPVNQNLNQYEFITHFSWRLFQSSRRLANIKSNIVISPLSVHILLTLVEQVSAGTTKYQLQSIIGNSNPLDIARAVDQITYSRTKNTSKLKIGSAMFPSHRLVLNETFRETARNTYVDVIPVNYNDQTRAYQLINSWAAGATADKITNIFSGSQPNVDLILANAIYFEGVWKYPFNQTVVDRFFQSHGQQKDVTYLKQTANLMAGHKIYRGIKIQWVELPYQYDDFSMVIMLPNEFKLDELVNEITESYFTDILGDPESVEKKRVHLRLPKFEMKIKMPLKTILQSMGVVDVFTDNANIPYLATDKVKIDDAQQDVYLSVDEKGTTAAAVTTFSVITLSSTSYDPEEMDFDVNQPFLAIILHKQTRLPIFIAKIFDP